MNGSWTNLVGRNTVQENNTTNQGRLGGMPALTGIRENWTRELIEIPASFYTSSNVWFRFEFSSDATAFNDFEDDLDDGFYIDDIRIVKSTSALIVLPVEFLNFTGKMQPDETVLLNWTAITDQQHDYFEIERSADGSDFTIIDKGPFTAPYRSIDFSPLAGNNFYRIRQVDKNGAVTYSQVINVYHNPARITVTVYPNPVKDILNIKLAGTWGGKPYAISIIDMAGRQVHAQNVVNSEGKEININLGQQPAQLYFLLIRNDKNEIISRQKIIKQN
jgi:hypothetical protein